MVDSPLRLIWFAGSGAVGSDQNLAVLLEHILEVVLNRVLKAHIVPPESRGENRL